MMINNYNCGCGKCRRPHPDRGDMLRCADTTDVLLQAVGRLMPDNGYGPTGNSVITVNDTARVTAPNPNGSHDGRHTLSRAYPSELEKRLDAVLHMILTTKGSWTKGIQS